MTAADDDRDLLSRSLIAVITRATNRPRISPRALRRARPVGEGAGSAHLVTQSNDMRALLRPTSSSTPRHCGHSRRWLSTPPTNSTSWLPRPPLAIMRVISPRPLLLLLHGGSCQISSAPRRLRDPPPQPGQKPVQPGCRAEIQRPSFALYDLAKASKSTPAYCTSRSAISPLQIKQLTRSRTQACHPRASPVHSLVTGKARVVLRDLVAQGVCNDGPIVGILWAAPRPVRPWCCAHSVRRALCCTGSPASSSRRSRCC